MPTDPFTDLRDALRDSERLKGVRIEVGPEHRATTATTSQNPRIVIVPTGGRYEPSEHKENLPDEWIELEFFVWAKNYAEHWRVRQALILAVWDYRLSTAEVNIQHRRIEFDTDPDTTRDGRAATLTFELRSPVEIVDLDLSEETVEEVAFDGTTDVTITEEYY